MTLKRYIRLAAGISVGGCLLFCVAQAPAQTVPTPGNKATPSPTPRPHEGHIRLWNVILSNATSLDLVLGSGPTARVLQTASTANLTPVYETLPPGRCQLSIFRGADRQTPLKTFDVNLLDRSYCTIYVQHLPGGQLSAEIIDDTPDPAKPISNQLAIHQVSFITRGVIAAAAAQQSTPMDPGATQTFTGLPDGPLVASARAMTPKGFKSWTAELDFKQAHHATLFILSDAYKRLTLRVVSDGPSSEEQAEAVAAFKASQPTR